MGMSRRDYQMVAEALKVVGEEILTLDPLAARATGHTWWRMVDELSRRFSEDNPRFEEIWFRAAAMPTQEARS